jgi:membrane-bound metal-dependent hydrolase YbcI (DUF457 family)
MLLFAHTGIALAAGRFSKNVDLLFLAIGSMLPDLIDKPLGWMIYGTPNMGRIFAHTLLFLLILAALALYSKDIRIISLAAGVSIHLLLDFMWLSQVILFWPILGSFPQAPYMDALSYMEMLLLALRKPWVLVPECLGLAYLIYFAVERKPNAMEHFKRFEAYFHQQCHRIKVLVENF